MQVRAIDGLRNYFGEINAVVVLHRISVSVTLLLAGIEWLARALPRAERKSVTVS